jgi:vacuolar-type H+-ATPase subunit I/STV1
LDSSLQRIEQEIKSCHDKLEQLGEQSKSIESQSTDLKLIERDVEDVLQYRRMERELSELEGKGKEMTEGAVSEREERDLRARLTRCRVELERLMQEVSD